MMKLGDKVKDTITGFTGILVSRTVYLAGCVRVSIQSQSLGKDGNVIEAEHFDEDLVALVTCNGKKKAKPSTGGSGVVPPSRAVDSRN